MCFQPFAPSGCHRAGDWVTPAQFCGYYKKLKINPKKYSKNNTGLAKLFTVFYVGSAFPFFNEFISLLLHNPDLRYILCEVLVSEGKYLLFGLSSDISKWLPTSPNHGAVCGQSNFHGLMGGVVKGSLSLSWSQIWPVTSIAWHKPSSCGDSAFKFCWERVRNKMDKVGSLHRSLLVHVGSHKPKCGVEKFPWKIFQCYIFPVYIYIYP